MIKINEKSRCSGCAACCASCPTQAIIMTADDEGFLFPNIDIGKCINCGKCERICPVINKLRLDVGKNPSTFAVINKNDEIRMRSSSGGVFYSIAHSVIERGGIVFGARFDERFRVIHDFTDCIEGIKVFQGSKYVQSDVGKTYTQAKEFLEKGKLVLYTGTPCQIGGLKAFLNKDYDNLICQDIICHGVPSPMVWQKYIEYREAKAAAKLRRTFFRHKKYGWKMYSVQFEFTNCTEYIQILSEDLYMRSFLRNLCLRPSCYNCAFKSVHRQSDVTLADFWGVENILPQMDDNNGTSLVLIHSTKGQTLFEKVSKEFDFMETDFERAILFNSAMIKSVPPNKSRERFLSDIYNKPFDMVVHKYCDDNFLVRIKKILKKFIKNNRNKSKEK